MQDTQTSSEGDTTTNNNDDDDVDNLPSEDEDEVTSYFISLHKRFFSALVFNHVRIVLVEFRAQ